VLKRFFKKFSPKVGSLVYIRVGKVVVKGTVAGYRAYGVEIAEKGVIPFHAYTFYSCAYGEKRYIIVKWRVLLPFARAFSALRAVKNFFWRN